MTDFRTSVAKGLYTGVKTDADDLAMPDGTTRRRLNVRKPDGSLLGRMSATDSEWQQIVGQLAIPVAAPAPDPPGWPAAWPWSAVPAPVMPTGLSVVTSGYVDRDGTEYRGLMGATPNVHAKRVILRDCALEWLGVASPAEDVWMIGGSLGPSPDDSHPMIGSGFQEAVAKRVVLDGVRIHGMHQYNPQTGALDPNIHTEGLQIGGVDVAWIRNCRFEDNHVVNVFLRCWSPAPVRYVLIENCYFGRTSSASGSAYYCARVAGDGDATRPTHVVIRNCQYPADRPISIDPGLTDVVEYGNVAYA